MLKLLASVTGTCCFFLACFSFGPRILFGVESPMNPDDWRAFFICVAGVVLAALYLMLSAELEIKE